MFERLIELVGWRILTVRGLQIDDVPPVDRVSKSIGPRAMLDLVITNNLQSIWFD